MNIFATLPNSIVQGNWHDSGTFDMLRNSLQHTPGILSLVLLSNDGIVKAAYGIDVDDAQRITAACSAMASLSAHLSTGVDGGQVLHTVVTMQNRNVAVTACGEGSTLFVALEPSAPIGLALGEIVRKARAYAEQMGTQSRADLPAR